MHVRIRVTPLKIIFLRTRMQKGPFLAGGDWCVFVKILDSY
jgi:hypothetical protein